jgi:hypothetical protein
VESSQQIIETEPAPGGARGRIPRRGRIGWLITDRDTTPGKLRVARLLLVLGILFAGSLAAAAAQALVDTIGDIEHLETFNANVTTLYRSLADADSTVAVAFLSGGVEPAGPRQQYERDRALASDILGRAAAQTAEQPDTVNLIGGINHELLDYTGYVERVRANNRQGTTSAGRAYLGLAAELMKTKVLPQAAELQRRQAARLDDAYRRAEWLPMVALAACAVSVAGLVKVQRFVFHRTHRVVNFGLLAASVLVLVGLAWWIPAGVASAHALTSSQRHIQSVSDALGPAQIAALQARAIETNRLVSGSATEQEFNDQIDQLGKNLDAAQRFDTDQEARALVVRVKAAAGTYTSAHDEVQKLVKGGAGVTKVDAAASTTATTFTVLDGTLTEAIMREGTAFGDDIQTARGWWLAGLPYGTGLLALVAAVGVVLGIRQRLEEYR